MVERWPAYRCIAIDVIGHGQSAAPADPARYAVPAFVEDITAVLDALGVERIAVLGYSMGGRLALHFALARPERVAALVLESAAPGFDDLIERAARIRSDEELADRIESEGLEWFVDYWGSIPLWDSQKNLSQEARDALRAQRLRNSTTGLANSLRGMGAGAQEPVLARVHELQMPVLYLAGALDQRYAELARTMAGLAPRSDVRVVPDAGHAAHLERPDVFAGLVLEFLSRCYAAEKVEA
jgi:2-succinyl-6-hydroxy-2,4-cyclohexadiene-1-carboxylate synthase